MAQLLLLAGGSILGYLAAGGFFPVAQKSACYSTGFLDGLILPNLELLSILPRSLQCSFDAGRTIIW